MKEQISKIRNKLALLMATFLFFFIIFIIQNLQYLKSLINWNSEDILSKYIAVTDIIFFICSLIGTLAILSLVQSSKGAKNLPKKIEKIEEDKEINLTFFVTYILPLITIEFNDIYHYIGFILILFLLMMFCYKTDYWYTNPILNILKFKTYRIKYEGEEEGKIALSREKISNSKNIETWCEYKNITEDIIFIKKA